jgi:hypothetical protein
MPYGPVMKRALTVVFASVLMFGTMAAPAFADRKPATSASPVLAVCLGTTANAGALGTFQNRPVSRPPAVIVDCPEGGDDDPRGISADTILTNVTWSQWGRTGARGTGTLNVPGTTCTYTSPANGTPAEVQAMCSTCGEVCNATITTPYAVAIRLLKPVRLGKKQRTFTSIAVTYTNGGPDGKSSDTFTPPRRVKN